MRTKRSLIIAAWAVMVTTLLGCHPTDSFHSDPDNGLSVSKHINGLEITVKFLSPDHLVKIDEQKTGRRLKPAQRDSVKSLYKNSLVFLMTLAPEKTARGSQDVLTRGISSQVDFNERLNLLNFHMDKMLTLRIGESDIAPALASMESTGGLADHRSIYIVFASNGIKSPSGTDSVALIFRDGLFDTGTSYFPFRCSDLFASN